MNKSVMYTLLVVAVMTFVSPVKADPDPGNANLVLWLDAEDLDGDGNVEGLSEDGVVDGKVATWIDKATYNGSQNGTQSDTNQRPAYVLGALNGKPVARFDVDRLLTGLDIADNFTLIAVAKEDQRHIGAIFGHAASNNGDLQFGDVKGGSSDYNYGRWSGWSAGGSALVNNLAIVDQNWSVLSLRAESTPEIQWTITKNGRGGIARTVTHGPANNNQIRAVQIGASNAANEWWDGDIAEVLVYNKTLTDQELDEIGKYLAQKYDVNYYDYVDKDNPNLLLWLDAGDLDGDGNVEGLSEEGLDGGKITNWVDKATSNGSQNAVQLSASQQPAYELNSLNGKPVASFDADRLLTGLSISNTFTVVAVAKENQRHIGGIVGHADYHNGDIQFGDVLAGGNDYNNGLWCAWSAGRSAFANILAPVDQEWSILSLSIRTSPSARWLITKNGIGGDVTVQTAGPGMNNAITSLQVGAADSGNEFWDGDIAEVLVFDYALSYQELEQVGDYLSEKYAINFESCATPDDVPYVSGSDTYYHASNYKAINTIDGCTASFCAIMDDSLDGTVDTVNPPYGSAPVTGHLIYDMGADLALIKGVRLVSRNDGAGDYNPSSVDFFCYVDDDPSDNAIPDDIENDDDIVLLANYTFASLKNTDWEMTLWDGVPKRYIGMRVNSSLEEGASNFNYQFSEISFLTDPFEWPAGTLLMVK